MVHTHGGTCSDRYPAMFRAARARTIDMRGQDMGGRALRILSFGCSTGAEMRTARHLFPQAEILGCDIDMTRAEPDLPGEVFFSTPEAIASRGPYDIIFANSVLCVGRRRRRDFPFSAFESLVAPLHAALRPGGLFCVYNASYRFTDLSFAGEYRPVRCTHLVENGFLPKFARNGARLSKREKSGGVNRQKIVRPDLATDWDFRDCIFEKASGEQVFVDLSGVRIPGAPAVVAPAYVPKWRAFIARLVGATPRYLAHPRTMISPGAARGEGETGCHAVHGFTVR